MSIVRVFPRRTSYTPTDELAFVGDPPMLRPPAGEVHISCTFTWDIQVAARLSNAWSQYYPVVKLGGPAFGDAPTNFIPGQYNKLGVTYTTRGCNFNCPPCLVHDREGKLHEIENFAEGYIIQDNNLLQASHSHIERVFHMLRQQRHAAVFAGGIDADLVTDEVAEGLRSLRIEQLFLAADCDGQLPGLKKAVQKLSFLPRDKLRCYVLLAFNGESLEHGQKRLEAVWEIGYMPFAQLYQPPDGYINYAHEWKSLARTWSRPAAMKSLMKERVIL